MMELYIGRHRIADALLRPLKIHPIAVNALATKHPSRVGIFGHPNIAVGGIAGK